MAFECWGCGACCRFAGFKDPALDRGDKACIHLLEDNSCAIYEDRPDFCRLNPDTPVEVQTKVCQLQEANWPEYVEILLQGVDTNPSGVVHSPGIEKEDG